MADLISMAAACECIGKMIHEYREEGEYALADGMILVRRYGIKCLPAVDAVPVVHGSWIEGNGGDEVCSVCGKECSDFVEGCDGIKYTEYLPNYCPNCGAKMDGERRDDDGKDA